MLARNFEFTRDLLARQAHRHVGSRVDLQEFRIGRVQGHLQRRRHVLRTAGNDGRGAADHDALGSNRDGLET